MQGMLAAGNTRRVRERLVVGVALVVVCALAWWLTLIHAHGMHASSPHTGRVAGIFVMWLVMMAAMMLPAVLPMVDVFAAVSRQRHHGSRAYARTTLFVGGYLIAWSGYSAVATAAHWLLERSGLLDTMMRSTSDLLAGGLFLAAGLYQWTPLKQACLRRCRSPLEFVLTHWRKGAAGAFIMGTRHGLYCVGCCWMLMLLLFVGGVMNIAWIAGLAAFVLLEKLAPAGGWVSRAAGAGLVLWGVATLVAL